MNWRELLEMFMKATDVVRWFDWSRMEGSLGSP